MQSRQHRRRGGLTVEGAQNRRLGHSYGPWGQEEGQAESGKHWALRVRESVFKFSPFSLPIPAPNK